MVFDHLEKRREQKDDRPIDDAVAEVLMRQNIERIEKRGEATHEAVRELTRAMGELRSALDRNTSTHRSNTPRENRLPRNGD